MNLPIRVLLIDSHAEERRLSRRMLIDDVPKLEIQEVADVCALVEALDADAPVVAIVDQDLGWTDGAALLRQLKRRWPTCYTLLFTAARLDDVLPAGTALRCDAVLRKDTAGWNGLGSTVLGLVAESREAERAERRVQRGATSAVTAAASGDAGTRAQPPDRGAMPGPADAARDPSEDAGASTLDWFPEVEESEADEEARAASTREAQGPVHQLLPAVNLESVILTAMSQLKPLIRSSRARVRAGRLPTLRLDRTDGLALFRNLIANAIEHCGDRPPVVTIHAERREDYWLLSVHDNGNGIAAGDVGEALRLIHPPGRHDDEDDEGGLATCGQVARRYGGALWVQPRTGGGTSVYVALCTAKAPSSDDVSVTVQFQGRDMGRISVSTLSNKQQIAGRALELPGLKNAIRNRNIRDVVFIDADVVKVVV